MKPIIALKALRGRVMGRPQPILCVWGVLQTPSVESGAEPQPKTMFLVHFELQKHILVEQQFEPREFNRPVHFKFRGVLTIVLKLWKKNWETLNKRARRRKR